MLASVALAARAEALNGLRHGGAGARAGTQALAKDRALAKACGWVIAGGFVPQQACLPSGNHRDSEARA